MKLFQNRAEDSHSRNNNEHSLPPDSIVYIYSHNPSCLNSQDNFLLIVSCSRFHCLLKVFSAALLLTTCLLFVCPCPAVIVIFSILSVAVVVPFYNCENSLSGKAIPVIAQVLSRCCILLIILIIAFSCELVRGWCCL